MTYVRNAWLPAYPYPDDATDHVPMASNYAYALGPSELDRVSLAHVAPCTGQGAAVAIAARWQALGAQRTGVMFRRPTPRPDRVYVIVPPDWVPMA